MAFSDHFSGVAAGYAAFRPRYPDSLFAELARLAPARDCAWDCATGSGQAAASLARHFRTVVATDASEEQIAAATPHDRVTFRVAPAESSGLPAESADLVTVAQAVHWLDIPRFFSEAERVLVRGGLVAVWCYGLPEIDPVLDTVVRNFYTSTVGDFWPAERILVDTAYRTIALPFDETVLPDFRMESDLTLDAFAGCLRTWSAVSRYRKAHGHDPVGPLAGRLAQVWGAPHERRRVRWPLAVRAGFRRARA